MSEQSGNSTIKNIFLVLLGMGICFWWYNHKSSPPPAKEEWSIVRVVSKHSDKKQYHRTVEVNGCLNVAGQTRECSVSSEKGFSITSGETFGADIGCVVAAKDIQKTFGTSETESRGETTSLASPPPGQIFRYNLLEEYESVTGEVLIQLPSSGETKQVEYRFDPNCKVVPESYDVLECSSSVSSDEVTVVKPKEVLTKPVEKTVRSENKLPQIIRGLWAVIPNKTPAWEFLKDGRLRKVDYLDTTYKFIDDTHIDIAGDSGGIFEVSQSGTFITLKPTENNKQNIVLMRIDGSLPDSDLKKPNTAAELKAYLLGKWQIRTWLKAGWEFKASGEYIKGYDADGTYDPVDSKSIKLRVWNTDQIVNIDIIGKDVFAATFVTVGLRYEYDRVP
ncbi:MAG: hypothetical protein HYR87_07495 [Thaumarchaeota archaeon]|nr:hypothetical protein [Nitrososphaerota archaeon]